MHTLCYIIDVGPIRKIKPISADIDHSETATPAKQLQVIHSTHILGCKNELL